MKSLLTLWSAILISSNSFSQYQGNNWAFGDSIGLNFNTGEPEFFDTRITAFEAAASVSDSSGNLLFYTDGESVWDRTNNMMPNGDSLEIGRVSFGGWGSSVSQGVLIFPWPDSNHFYYIIYLSDWEDVPGELRLTYSIVDMTLNGGLGDVKEKNIDLTTDQPFWENLQIVKHGNGRDWWIVLLSNPQSEGSPIYFIKYLATPDGIAGPYSQDYGDVFHIDNGAFESIGQMKFSQDGSKYINTMGRDLDIFDFDRCSGQFSNYINIDTVDMKELYGAEFSPDGQKIYTTSYGNGDHAFLYQFCLDCGMDVHDTKKAIYEATNNNSVFAHLQLASNRKIYMCGIPFDNAVINNLNKYLSVINNPNADDLLCNFDTLTIFLNGNVFHAGLPNMPNYDLGPLTGSECDTLLTSVNTIPVQKQFTIYPNPAIDFIFIDAENIYNDLTVELYNMLGEKVFENNSLSVHQKINLPYIANGIYTILIKNGDTLLYSEKLAIAN